MWHLEHDRIENCDDNRTWGQERHNTRGCMQQIDPGPMHLPRQQDMHPPHIVIERVQTPAERLGACHLTPHTGREESDLISRIQLSESIYQTVGIDCGSCLIETSDAQIDTYFHTCSVTFLPTPPVSRFLMTGFKTTFWFSLLPMEGHPSGRQATANAAVA